MEEIGDREVGADVSGNLGTLFQAPGENEEAKEHHEKEGAVTKVTGDREVETAVYGNLGTLLPQSCGQYDKVPNEIKARGPRAKLAYENALKTGKVKMNRVRVMLIGQDRAGKTSLKKSILGQPFDPEEQSTEGIEVDPSKFIVDFDQVGNWQPTGKLNVSQFMEDVARIVAEKLQEEKTMIDSDVSQQNEPKDLTSETNQVKTRGDKTQKLKEARVSHHMARHSENATGQLVIPEWKIDPALSPKEFTHFLIQHLKGLNLQSDATGMKQHITLELWDFAGQHDYYDSYPVFLSSRAVYVLVYNLSKALKNIAQPCVRRGNNDIPINNPIGETNLENVLSWLCSVSTLCASKPEVDESKTTEKDLPDLHPPIFIVGTHADKPQQDIKEMELQIQKAISGKDFEDRVIYPFFSVDNTQKSPGKGVAELKKRMIEVLKQEPYMGEEIPLRWFHFENVVEALVAKETYYLTLEQLQEVIQKVCLIENVSEADTMLDFYHDLGMIVKCRNTVILRALWLIDVFKQLVTIRSISDKEDRHAKLWKEMEKTGVLSMELFEDVVSKFCQQDIIKEDILNVMEKFGLIAKFATSPTDVQYFVPSQLKMPPGRLCFIEPSPSDPCPLYLHFPRGFVPHGLFSQLVSRCISWCSESGFKQPPNLFKGASRFFVEKELIHQLIFICKIRCIKVVLKQKEQNHGASFAENKEVARLVRTFLEGTMQNLKRQLPWFSNLPYDLCVACPNCPGEEDQCFKHSQVFCAREDCLCLVKILEGGQLSQCPDSSCDNTITIPGLDKWFPITAVRPGYHPGTHGDVYKMTALPRGIALIINNSLFIDRPTREGTEKDVCQVEALFTALGFNVYTKENLTRGELLDELDSLACSDHSAYDCVVLWLMSHGKSGVVCCSDGKTLPIQAANDLLSKCATLTGKPKLLFIQACRGIEEDEGITVTADISSPVQLNSSHVDSPLDADKPPPSREPKHADFLNSYSTVDEHVSYRNEALGSFYVSALVEAFGERVAYDHLVDILTIVNNKVSIMEATVRPLADKNDVKILKQMPEFKSTLRKQVRF